MGAPCAKRLVQQSPLSTTPLPVANWPTRTMAELANQVVKELPLDNSV